VRGRSRDIAASAPGSDGEMRRERVHLLRFVALHLARGDVNVHEMQESPAIRGPSDHE
jgi:hypothetical protein